MSLALHVFAIEIKKAVSYRVAFWVNFLLGTTTDLLIAYFLWGAIFAASGSQTMQGFSFHGMVFYYLFATFSMKMGRGNDHGYLAQDIYDGGLTRYLIYPIHFFGFKYITHITQQMLAALQLSIAFCALWFILGIPPDSQLDLGSFAAGLLTCFFMGYLYFVLVSCLELVAFWQDVIWNLIAMLRFSMALLGGAMIPLDFFPAWGRTLVSFTPFPTMISFPARTFLGQVSLLEWFQNMGIMLVWSLAFTLLAAVIWKRGTKQYSGVGI